jgi:hypothetical protein
LKKRNRERKKGELQWERNKAICRE